MPISNTFQNILTEPTPRDINVLQQDLPEDDEDIGLELKEPQTHSHQTSFMNHEQMLTDSRVVQINQNTNQKLIIVTQDKVLLCLKKNLAMLGKRDWIAPMSTLITILISLITSDFKTALWLGPSEWKAIFVVSGFLATGWLASTVRKAMNAKGFNDIIRDVVYELGARRRPQYTVDS